MRVALELPLPDRSGSVWVSTARLHLHSYVVDVPSLRTRGHGLVKLRLRLDPQPTLMPCGPGVVARVCTRRWVVGCRLPEGCRVLL